VRSADAGKPSPLNETLAQDMRTTARDIFLQALREASVAKAFERSVEYSRGVLRVCDDLYPLDGFPRVFVIAFGKAAHSMLEGLSSQAGALSGIVAAPTEPAGQLSGFRYFLGGHPVPNEESVRAAQSVLKALGMLPPKSLVIYLISGGGSAALEAAIDPEISLDDLVATYRALVLSGAPIAEINAIRKHLSAIKGGRLARAADEAGAAQQVSLMVSDVPERTPDALASGSTMADSSTVAQCYAIAEKYRLLPEFPAAVRGLFEQRALEETPKSDDPCFSKARWWPLLANAEAQRAAAAAATRAGFAVEIDNTCDDWDYARAADYLLERLRTLRKGVSRICLISGGEVTVKVSAQGGTGGRNQQFALECAQKIAGENITVLSAGTDGIDGNSPAAGAVADGTTVARARSAGHDVGGAQARFDAYPLFHALGDAVVTGPTGNNIRDLRILLAY
jgi:glycerate 2-kinase